LQNDQQLESSKSLNDSFQKRDSLPKPTAQSAVLESFTNILFEALQAVNIIPGKEQNELIEEIDDLFSVVEAFNSIKNNLIDFKNNV
jgi:cobalamin biosynthesis Co2+ chelatase CbiK